MGPFKKGEPPKLTFHPVEVRSEDAVAAGAMVFRHRGALHLTAIVKATLSLAPDGTMAPAPPEELLAADVHLDGDPRKSLLRAGDRVPFRPRADVVLTGHAYPGSGAGRRSAARLVVRRDRVLIDKTIAVVADRAVGSGPSAHVPLVYERARGGRGHDDNPVGVRVTPISGAPSLLDPRDESRPIGFGPLAPQWPIRARLAGSGGLAGLAVPCPEIPADLDWAFFQAAPRDQRIDFLQGDEEIVLEGLHPAAPRIGARLPGVRAWGVAHGHLAPGGPDRTPIVLEADGLHIDAERLLFTMTWRAVLPVAGERELAGVGLVLGLAVTGSRAAASGPRSDPRASPPSGAPRASDTYQSTLALTADAVEQALRAAEKPLPFTGREGGEATEPAAAPPRPPRPAPGSTSFDSTLDLGALPGWTPDAPAWLTPVPMEDAEAMTMRLPATAPAAPPPAERTLDLTAESIAAFQQAPFPIPEAAATPPSRELGAGTPWSAKPMPPAPRPAQAFEATLDLSRAPVTGHHGPPGAQPAAPSPAAGGSPGGPSPARGDLPAGLNRRFVPRKK